MTNTNERENDLTVEDFLFNINLCKDLEFSTLQEVLGYIEYLQYVEAGYFLLKERIEGLCYFVKQY